MYSYIKGRVSEKEFDRLTLENNGVGYEILVSPNTLSLLKKGDEALIYTYFQVKQDGIALLGFPSKEEKNMFSRLITVTGIGPKSALAILSEISPYDLAFAIAQNDSVKLSKVKGIGKKTAARIVLELKEKIDLEEGVVLEKTDLSSIGGEGAAAAVALQALGFSKTDSVKAVEKAMTAASGTENIIRAALRLIRQ
ncbi:MAG: Holliday junction branch migration protein RuvA [Clostridiales bacterium]|jgi:Holliday junction DNA helicase RuvA|nr:Holliday junction branch migration protein RuvA [Clostridiales bacterium]